MTPTHDRALLAPTAPRSLLRSDHGTSPGWSRSRGLRTGLAALLPALLSVLAGCGGDPPGLGAPAEAALPPEVLALVPDDALVLVRIESLDALSASLDRSRPLALALTLPAGARTPADAFGEPLPGGVLSVRIDAARLLEATRPLVGMALVRFEDMASMGLPPGASLFDTSTLVGSCLEGVRTLLDATERVDPSLVSSGGRCALHTELRFRPGSPPSRFAQTPTSDAWPLVGALDPEAAIRAVGRADFAALMRDNRSLMARLIAVYPPEMQDVMLASMTGYDEMLGLTGGAFAVSGDLGPGGLHVQ